MKFLHLILFSALTTCISFGAEPTPTLKSDTSKKPALLKDSLISKVKNDALPGPSIKAKGGAYASGDHSFIVEDEIIMPLWKMNKLFLYQVRKDNTPFVRETGQQVEALNSLDELRVDYEFSEDIALRTGGAYQRSLQADSVGREEAFKAIIGAGTPYRSLGKRLEWYAEAGPYIGTDNVDADWFLDGFVRYRVWDLYFLEGSKNISHRPGLDIEAKVVTANEGTDIGYLAEVGPTFGITTVNGSRLDLFAHYYGNHDNDFYMQNDDGVLFGFAIESRRETPLGTTIADWRDGDILSKVWGQYDIGFGFDGDYLDQFNVHADIFNFQMAGQPVTFYLDYANRRFYGGDSDFDNSLYDVDLGLRTPLEMTDGWEIMSNGQPLLVGAELFHRSDHVFDADAALVASQNKASSGYPNRYDKEGSINQLPRVKITTTGWQSPYAHPEIFEQRTAWINQFEWMFAMGLTVLSSGDRPLISSEAGLNWNIATIEGYVPYLKGQGGFGAASPEMLFETGFQRPAYKVFFRWEDYGLDKTISGGRDKVYYGGLGLHL